MNGAVQLTISELMQAGLIGLLRQCNAIKKHLNDRHGYDGVGWSEHVEGACGEMALAKLVDCYYSSSITAFKYGGDVGRLQVRTASRHDYRLIVRDDDLDDDVFVCVTGRAPDYRVRGWILGADAKRPEWKEAPGDREPAYFVPHAALQSLDALFPPVPPS